VIRNFNIMSVAWLWSIAFGIRLALNPIKANPPLVIDPNAPLTCSIPY